MKLIDYLTERPAWAWVGQIDPSVQYFGSGHVRIGEGSRIDAGCILMGNVNIGRRTHIAPYCLLYGAYDIVIGDICNLGAMTIIHTESESFDGEWLMGPLVPEDRRRPERGRVKLENVVTVGARSTILAGAYLEKGVSIGAHSLVKAGTYHERGLYAGTPAKWIRNTGVVALNLAREVLG